MTLLARLLARPLAAALAWAVLAPMPGLAQQIDLSNELAPKSVPVPPVVEMIKPVDPACVRPVYPPQALDRRTTGTTRLRIVLDPKGKPVSIEVVGSAGPTREHRMLDIATKDAFAACTFVPARSTSGEPVPSEAVVSYTWKLE